MRRAVKQLIDKNYSAGCSRVQLIDFLIDRRDTIRMLLSVNLLNIRMTIVNVNVHVLIFFKLAISISLFSTKTKL